MSWGQMNCDITVRAREQENKYLRALLRDIRDDLASRADTDRRDGSRVVHLSATLWRLLEETLDIPREPPPDLSTMKGRREEAKRSLAARPAWMRRDAEDSE